MCNSGTYGRVATGAIRRAFTLVELLVVIGIIAVLIGILLPSLSRARESANTVSCASQMRQISIAVRMYALDNNDWFPTLNTYAPAPATPPVWYRPTWGMHLMSQLKMQYDPSQPYYRQYTTKSPFVCPGDDPSMAHSQTLSNGLTLSSYAANLTVIDCADWDYDGNGVKGPIKMSQAKHAAETIWLVERRHPQNGLATPFYTGTTYLTGKTLSYPAEAIAGYHNKKSGGRGVNNYAFIDGHVEAMDYNDTVAPVKMWEWNTYKRTTP